MYDSLQHSSAPARKLDGPIFVIQLKYEEWNLIPSSSVGRVGKVKTLAENEHCMDTGMQMKVYPLERMDNPLVDFKH